MYVCSCAAVSDLELRACISEGSDTLEAIGVRCGAGTGCGGCHPTINVLLVAELAPSVISDLPISA